MQELEQEVNKARVIAASWDDAVARQGGMAIRPMANYLEDLEVHSEALSAQINKITGDFKALEDERAKLVAEGTTLTPEFQTMDDELGAMVVRAKELQDTMDNLIAEGNIGTTAYESAEGEYQMLLAQMDELGNKMLQIKEEGRDTELVDPTTLSRLSEIDAEEERIKQETMALYAEWQKVRQAIEEANNAMAQGTVPSSASPTGGGGGIDTVPDDLDNTAVSAKEADAAIRSLMQTFRGLARFIPGVSARGVMAISLLNRGMDALANVTGKTLVAAVKKLGSTVLKFAQALLSNPILAAIAAAIAVIIIAVKRIKKLIDDTKKDVEALAKFGVKALKALASGFLALGKASVKAFVGLGVGVFKGIVNGISAVINKLMSLKSVITENLKLMAKWHSGNNAVNKSLSNLTSSLAYLKASLATAFAPILTTVEPMLTKLIDKLAEAITMIGMFIAKLLGATSFQKAIRVQKDYAKALDKTGSAAKKALAPFDELNVLQDKSGGAPVDFGLTDLEDVEFPDFLEKMSELGKTLGTKIRDFLNGIDWDKIKEGAEYAAKAIANFVNAFFGVEGLGKAVGKALGEVINTITLFANDLLNLIDWAQIGKQLGEALQSLIDTIHWDEVGQVFSNALNSLMELAYNFFTSWDGATLGQGLTELFQNAVGRIDWILIRGTLAEGIKDLTGFLNEIITPENFKLIGDTIGEALNTIFFSIGQFADGAEWEQWGQSIADGINNLFEKFDAKQAGTNLSNLAHGLLDMLLKAVDQIEWDQVSDKLVEFISNVDWAGIAKKAVEISQKLLNGLERVWEELRNSDAYDQIIDAIVDFLAEKKNWENALKRIKNGIIKDVIIGKIKEFFSFKWEEVGDLWGDASFFFNKIKEDFESGDWYQMLFGCASDIIAGLGAGLMAAIDLLTSPIQFLFDDIIQSIKNVFGIHSPATTMEPIGENIVLGILEGFGLVDFIQKVTEWWNTNVQPWFDKIKENIAILTEAISLKMDAFKTKLIDTFRAIKNGIKIPINGMIALVEGLVNKIIDGFNWLIDKLNKVSFTIPDWVPDWGGNSFGIDLPKLAPVQIPRLAQGAVLPPNNPFLAMLGDQKSGTNVEAPLSTIQEALIGALQQVGYGNSGQPINIYLGTEKIYSEIQKMEKRNIVMGG